MYENNLGCITITKCCFGLGLELLNSDLTVTQQTILSTPTAYKLIHLEALFSNAVTVVDQIDNDFLSA